MCPAKEPGGPLHSYISGFTDSLANRGYSKACIAYKAHLVRAFDQWMRQRPLRKGVVGTLRTWMRELLGGPTDPLFPSARGGRLSRDAAERILAKHVDSAGKQCPTIAKKHVSMHVLRHSVAMDLLHQGVDRSVIALWLGHESI